MHFRAIFNLKIAFLQFSGIMRNRRRCCVWLYPEHPDRGFLICAMVIAKKIGVSASQLSRIVSGETKTVNSDILIGVAKEFKVSMDYILGFVHFECP